MKASRAVLAGVFALAAVVGACSAVSHVAAIQPPSVSDVNAQKQALLTFRKVSAPPIQAGVGIDFYTYPGQNNIMTGAEQTIAYVKGLHANSVSISFPFFVHGFNSSDVYGSPDTPSPEQIAEVASVAENAGLYVSLRPLLDESSLGTGHYRTNWKPAHPAAWFGSYQKFLLPYAQMAQKDEIPEFVDGAELSYFPHSPLWNGLVAALKTVYTGTLVYDSNFADRPFQGSGGHGVTEAVDAYQPLNLPDSAGQARVTAGWLAYDRTLPPRTVLLEVDIAAVSGAYIKPFTVGGLHPTSILPWIQIRWFTGACDALSVANLGGIYFWGVGLGANTPLSTTNPAGWVNSPGEVVISQCLAKLSAT